MKFKNWGSGVAVCTGPLTYVGDEITKIDIANLKAAMNGKKAGAYLPSVAPGTIEHWLHDEHYRDTEAFLFAIADAMAKEYKAITDAGFLLQIDDPGPAGRLADVSRHVGEGLSQVRRAARRGAQSRAEIRFRAKKSGCISAGAATTDRTRTTFRSRTSSTSS